MDKLCFSLIILFLLFFSTGCSNMSMIEKNINTSPKNLSEIMKDMIIKENHEIEDENELGFTTKWRRASKEEDNYPDNTVEVKLKVSIMPDNSRSKISMRVMKRSTLYSTDQSNITYTDIGIIQNDKLYMRWNEKIKELVKEFEKK